MYLFRRLYDDSAREARVWAGRAKGGVMVAEKSDCTHHCPYIPMTNVSESTRFSRGGPAERLTEVPGLELLAESHGFWLTMLRL